MRELVVLNESPEVAIALRYASVGLWMVVAAQAFGALCSNQSKRRTRDEEDAFDTDFVRSEEYTEGYSDRVPRNVNRKGQSWDCMKITSIAPTIVFVVACSLLAVHTMQFQEAVPSTASGDEMRGAIVVRAIPLIDAARSRDADLTRCPATLNRLQLYAISVRLRSCDSRLPAVGKRGVPIKRGQAMTNQNIYLFFSFGFLLAAYVETGRGGTRALLIELSLEIVLWFLICCCKYGARFGGICVLERACVVR